MSEYAVLPLADYTEACEAAREMTGTSDKITSGQLAGKIRAISKGENLDDELENQDDLIEDIMAALEGKAAGGGGSSGGGDVGGLTKYARTTATPTSNVTFTITNPLGGLAKKVSIRCPEGSTTETAQGLVQLYTIDTTVGLGAMKILNASTGNVTVYGARQTTSASANSQFAISDGTITARAYNATTATWDTSCEYEIEIWQ